MISVVIVAWNEESHLPGCLASVKNLASDIVVVVDEATTDNTARIAKKSSCRVFTHPHVGIVEPMRNFAISQAKHQWVLVLDADEQVTPALSELLVRLVAENKYDYVRLPRKNIIFGKWITSQHWWPDYVYRLFKKDKLTWNDAIHSQPLVKGVGYDIPPSEDVCLVHHNYQSVEQFVNRLNRYTAFQAKEKVQPDDWSVWLQNLWGEFLSQLFSRNGYQDGSHGLALSLLQSFSSLIVDLKVWERHGFKPAPVSLDQLKPIFAQMNKDLNWWLCQSQINSSNGIKRLYLKVRTKLLA